MPLSIKINIPVRRSRIVRAEAELDDIWLYVARESGSIETANRLIDTISDRFLLLAQHPQIGYLRLDARRRPGQAVVQVPGGVALKSAARGRSGVAHIWAASRRAPLRGSGSRGD